MSERTDRDLLSDIREAIHRISTYIVGASYEIFAADIKTQDAVIRNLEIIGEASKNLSEQVRTEYPISPGRTWQGSVIDLSIITSQQGANSGLILQ